MGTLHNHHSHCHYCDGSDPMENYVKKAVESGFQSYGFSSHVPLKIQSDWSLTVEGFKKYIADFQLLKEKFAHQIELYCGLETDFIFSFTLRDEIMRQYPVISYTIGSVHYIEKNGQILEVDAPGNIFYKGFEKHYQNDTDTFIQDYFRFMRRMITEEKPDIIGHLDKIKLHQKIAPALSQQNPVYLEEVLLTLDMIQKENLILEVNTRGIYKKLVDEPYPAYWILNKALEKGISIQLNSDAHHPREIEGAFSGVREKLKNAGFNRQSVFLNHSFQHVKL